MVAAPDSAAERIQNLRRDMLVVQVASDAVTVSGLVSHAGEVLDAGID